MLSGDVYQSHSESLSLVCEQSFQGHEKKPELCYPYQSGESGDEQVAFLDSHQRLLCPGKWHGNMSQLLFQGQTDLIASGLDFSDCHGEKGMGKAGGLWEYRVKILFYIYSTIKEFAFV